MSNEVVGCEGDDLRGGGLSGSRESGAVFGSGGGHGGGWEWCIFGE